jgi:hypothetical protein
VDDEEDKDIENYGRKYLTWVADPCCSSPPSPCSPESISKSQKNYALEHVLSHDDLYDVLGLVKATHLDKLALRRAYLSRSRSCHPEQVYTILTLPDLI